MRTTVVLDDDTNRAVQQLQQERGLNVSQAVNELNRRGLLPRRPDPSRSASGPRRSDYASTCPPSPGRWRTSRDPRNVIRIVRYGARLV